MCFTYLFIIHEFQRNASFRFTFSHFYRMNVCLNRLYFKNSSLSIYLSNLGHFDNCCQVFRLQNRGWNFADIAFPLYAIEFYLISDKAYYNSLLPQLVLALSLLAIGLCGFFLLRKRIFISPFLQGFLAS